MAWRSMGNFGLGYGFVRSGWLGATQAMDGILEFWCNGHIVLLIDRKFSKLRRIHIHRNISKIVASLSARKYRIQLFVCIQLLQLRG